MARGGSDGNYIEPLYGSDGTNGNAFELSETNLICEPGVTVANIKEKYEKAKVINASGKEVTSGNVGTGYTVKNEDTTYTIVKLGDVNGDGKMTPADSTVILRAYVGLDEVTSAEKTSADTNGDGKLTPADSTLILRAYVGLDNIEI